MLVVASLSAALFGAGAGTLGGATSASAATTPSCVNTLYSVDWFTGTVNQIALPNGSANGAGVSSVVGDLGVDEPFARYNALALTTDGKTLFAADQSPGTGDYIYRMDVATGAVTAYPNAQSGIVGSLIGGAINPLNGLYYLFTFGPTPTLYAFNTTTNTWIGKVASFSATSSGMDGGNISDIAFDANGTMFFTANTTSNGHSLYRLSGPVPSTAGSVTLTPSLVSANLLPNNGVAGSLAFGSTGNLYLGQIPAPQIQELNPANGAVVSQSAGTPIPGSPSDFASCAQPSTLTVKKNVVSRANASDQFTLGIGGLHTPATATTTGSATGVQSAAAGPVVVSPGASYPVTETGAGSTDLTAYSKSYQCVDSNNNVLASGSASSFNFTVPPPVNGHGVAATCTFTNTPLSRSYTVKKTASSATVLPGGVLSYSVAVTNTGPLAYTAANPASFTDNLSAVLDDATYNGDATNGATVTGNTLSWSGALGVGQTVIVTYSVTVKNPDTGDRKLTNAITPTGPGGSCVAAADCTTTTIVPTASYTVHKSSSKSTAKPGDVVGYSVTVKNTGGVAYTAANPASFTDDLSAVLDDATYNNDASNGATVSGNTLSWSGALPVNGSVTVTYSVTVKNPDTGDHVLKNAVVATAPGGGCDVTGGCTTTTPVASFAVKKTANKTTAKPGDVVTYSVAMTNTGQVAYTAAAPASFTDDLTNVLDDATYNNDATNGATYAAPVLSWSGALAIGQTVTVTYSVTVKNPDTGDGRLDNVVVTPPEANCPAGSTDPNCTVTIPSSSYTVHKTASKTSALPGDTVAYTVTVKNTGQQAYTAANPATFTDDLSSVLDDAAYNNDASGGATVSGNTLSWSGALPVGGTATITYSVTVKNPDTGDHVLKNAVVPTAPGGGCDTPGGCTTTTPVAGYTVHKSASAATAKPGDTITYSVAVKNTGQVAYTAANPATFTDDLSAVLDDAMYNNDASGGATVSGNTLSWSGALPVGGTATITYSVTVKDPDTGDHVLKNAVVPTAPGGGCDTPGGCVTTTPIASYTVHKSASASTAKPGDTITYSVAVKNTGQTAYTAANPATFTDDLSAVLDDATYNNDASGGATVTGNTLSWSGALPVGGTATITYSVTVKNPDTGDHVLKNAVVPTGPGGGCDTPGGCTTTTPVTSYTVHKSASATTVLPGGVLTYSVKVVNTGGTAYTAANPASFTDDLSAVLDDATYNGDATGGATVSGNTLSWAGALPVNGSVTITYSVTVKDPDTGDRVLTNAVVPTAPGGTCDTPGGCQTTTTVPGPSFTVHKSVSASSAKPGDVLTYTVSATNTGAVPYTAASPASFTDDLSALLDDATYNGDATNGATVSGNTLSWTGTLGVNQTVTVTYSVTVKDPDAGDHVLKNAVVPTAPGGGCDTPGGCTTTTPVAGYTVHKSASAATAKPGDTITYSVAVKNTGQTAYTAANPATFTDDLSAVLDDATYNNDASGGATVSGNTLSWSGALPVGGTATITYSVTVKNPDTGDHVLKNAVVPTAPGGGCDTPGGCTTTTPVASYTVEKTASAATVLPNGVLTYKVKVVNTGQVAYTAAAPASFTDDLSAVLDDATYNGDATGGATVTGTTLSWSGALPIGGSVTITYSVTVKDPDTGDRVLTNAVVPTGPGGTCATAGGCETTTTVPGPSFTVHKSVSASSAKPGDVLTYTVSATNTGSVPYSAASPASFTDDLSAVLDDATYNGDATNGATVTGNTLSWTGTLAVNQTVTVTYSVTVKDPDTGDHQLTNAVVPTAPGGGCDTPGGCTTTTPVAGYTVHKSASAATAKPGDTITYSVAVKNTGQVAYTAANPATFTDDLSAVLDDATYNNDASGGATISGHTLSWSGALPVGGTATITYSVKIKDPDTGDHVLTNAVVPTGPGGSCDTPGGCTTTTPVADFRVKKTSTAIEAHPGDVVHYSVTVQNTGQVDYTAASPASFTDDLSNVLDDATYNNDASSGATYSAPVLSWSGALAIGQMVTVDYSVTVNTPDTGDARLDNVVVTPPGGGNCPPGSTDPDCTVTVPTGSYVVMKSASATTAKPGDVIGYQVDVTNTGNTDYTAANPASFTDNLAAVLDDATYNGDVTGGATVSGTTLSWSGPLKVGETVSIFYSVTVDKPDLGDHLLTNVVVPTGPGGSCDTPGACVTNTPVASFTVHKTATPATAVAGDVVKYAVTVTNTGKVPYTAASPASFTDDLTDVLDDASYNGDATNGATYSAPTLSWSGAVGVGQSVTVTYSVTVKAPDTGDHLLTNVVVPRGPDGSCDTPGGCTTTTPVASFTVHKAADPATTTPGGVVRYRVTVTNTGQVPYTAASPASFTDDLSQVLDDAVYNGDASNGATYSAPTVSWSGAVPVGGTVTVTYSVTVNHPDGGDHVLTNAVVPTGPGGTCDTVGGCETTTPVASYTAHKSVSTTSTVPGGVVRYSVTLTNTGNVAYTAANPATFTDDLSQVLDDASYNGDVSAGGSVTGSTLAWSGALPVGGSVTVSYSVTVHRPDHGDHILANAVVPTGPGGECDSDGGCTTTTPVAEYTVQKSVDTTDAKPGQKVGYTVTVTNTGKVPYTAASPASFSDDLSDVLDDATYNDDATSGATYAAPVLSWSGALPIQGTVQVAYSVTVNTPDKGDHVLKNAVVAEGPGGGCATPGGCVTTTPVKSYVVKKTASVSHATAGQTVRYSVKVTNTGKADYTSADPASFSDDLSKVLALARYNGDATNGAVFTSPVLSWAGAVKAGSSVTISYSVTVRDHASGTLTNLVVTPPGTGTNCEPGSTDPDCIVNIPVTPPGVSVHTGGFVADGTSLTMWLWIGAGVAGVLLLIVSLLMLLWRRREAD